MGGTGTGSARPSMCHRSSQGLLENLRALHQQMENTLTAHLNRMQSEQQTVQCIENDIVTDSADTEEATMSPQSMSASMLEYESADEKLSEWDMNVSVAAKESRESQGDDNDSDSDHADEGFESGMETGTPAQLRQHLKTLSASEKRLSASIRSTMREESGAQGAWCWMRQCFGQKPQQEGPLPGLLEQYMQTQVRRELIKHKYRRQRQRKRARTLKQRK